MAGPYQPRSVLHKGPTSPEPLILTRALRGLAASSAQDWPKVLPLLDDPLRALRFAAITALLPAYSQLSFSAREQLDRALAGICRLFE